MMMWEKWKYENNNKDLTWKSYQITHCALDLKLQDVFTSVCLSLYIYATTWWILYYIFILFLLYTERLEWQSDLFQVNEWDRIKYQIILDFFLLSSLYNKTQLPQKLDFDFIRCDCQNYWLWWDLDQFLIFLILTYFWFFWIFSKILNSKLFKIFFYWFF